MALIINHNMMALNAARNLGTVFDRLSKSTERLSSGLRINSAADDAAGLAIRELMRSDIAVLNQGLRNAADAISMIQTAEGALSVIDEKLTRMKELAEQASTGTYTTVQREIMNSEYQAMAREIDRIANATDFNGIKLLDGSLTSLHDGSGLKVHFGTGNDSTEDYYFVTIADSRATASTGLQVGGDSTNDIWGAGGSTGDNGTCCGGEITSLTAAYFQSGQAFAYGYNYDATANVANADLDAPSYLGGMYQMASGSSLQDLVSAVNAGTQSRVQINFGTGGGTSGDVADLNLTGSGGSFNICLGDEIYQFTSGTTASTVGLDAGATVTAVIDIYGAFSGATAAEALATYINSASSTYWALGSADAGTVHVFFRAGGDNDTIEACDLGVDGVGSGATTAQDAARLTTWTNMETYVVSSGGTTFGHGGEGWGTLTTTYDGSSYGVQLNGEGFGDDFDLYVADIDDFNLETAVSGTNWTNLRGIGTSLTELQDASDGAWDGAQIRTQSAAQEALAALDDAIVRKDIVRANLGALQNRLENTMTNIQIQAENLQAAESRISDVDVAAEMTEFTRNNIMAQAATAMLAQANSLAQLALSLLG